ncbi:Polycystin cation channel-domain-containing protein, partial [Baffinella frigidus]
YLAPNVPAGILGSAPIGEVRLRQLRSSGGEDSCSRTHKAFVLQGLARNGTGCYPRWGAVDEETVYTKANKVPGRAGKKEWYSYWSFLDTAVIPTLGRYGLYYGGGFVAKWPFVESHEHVALSHEHVALVEESHWIDTKTRVVFLDFAFFNPDLALFLSTEVLFEFPGHGAVEPRLAVQSISLIRYPSISLIRYPVNGIGDISISLIRYPVNGIGDIVRIGVVCFVYLMVVYYILDDVEYCRKKGLAKYASFGWPHVDVINVCLFVISGVWKLANQILVLPPIPKQ